MLNSSQGLGCAFPNAVLRAGKRAELSVVKKPQCGGLLDCAVVGTLCARLKLQFAFDGGVGCAVLCGATRVVQKASRRRGRRAVEGGG